MITIIMLLFLRLPIDLYTAIVQIYRFSRYRHKSWLKLSTKTIKNIMASLHLTTHTVLGKTWIAWMLYDDCVTRSVVSTSSMLPLFYKS